MPTPPLTDWLFDRFPEGLCILRLRDDAVVRVKGAWCARMGGRAEDLVGRTGADLGFWPDAAARDRAFDGGTAPILGHGVTGPRVDWAGEPCLVLAAAEAPPPLVPTTRSESEDLFLKAFQFFPSALGITHLKTGEFVSVNAAFLSMFGYAPGEVEGRTSLDIGLWADPVDRQSAVERLSRGEEVHGFEVVFRRKDGSTLYVAYSGRLVDLHGQTYLLSAAMDVTARRQADEDRQRLADQVAQAQKLDSLGSLAGGVAHDMNNVLAAILTLADFHQASAPEGSRLQKNMETIARACQRGGTLVKGLLGFARTALTEERRVDLNAVVSEGIALLERTTLQKVRIDVDLSESLHGVKGDPAALGHAFMNLCVNAVDAMPEGGLLTVKTWNEATGCVRLEVADTGCGMPPEVLGKALDPFFTTKPQGQGTGLGLSIVYRTVKAHGGDLQIRSHPGQGTQVALRFPAVPASTEAASPERPRFRRGRALRILVVDDDELIQQSLGPMLQEIGHLPRIVGMGEEALGLLEQGLEVDGVILDLNMPGIGGATTLVRLRALRPELPVLLATG
ncbi:MAG TPA: ATP-binding protein, partial [Holophagaceae bacterium]